MERWNLGDDRREGERGSEGHGTGRWKREGKGGGGAFDLGGGMRRGEDNSAITAEAAAAAAAMEE